MTDNQQAPGTDKPQTSDATGVRKAGTTEPKKKDSNPAAEADNGGDGMNLGMIIMAFLAMAFGGGKESGGGMFGNLLSGKGGGFMSMFSGWGQSLSNAKDSVVDTGTAVVQTVRNIPARVASAGREAIATVSSGWDRLKAAFVSDMPKDKKYVSAERSGNDIVYHTDDGSKVVKVRESTATASRSWANNNPGNIEFGNFAKSVGAIGSDGRFAVFPTVEQGFEAQKTLLRKNYSNLTLSQAIYKWAPPSENNSAAYVSAVCAGSNINPGSRICDLNDQQLDLMVRTMANHEGWKQGKVAVINNGTTTVASARDTGSVTRTADANNSLTAKTNTAFAPPPAGSPSVGVRLATANGRLVSSPDAKTTENYWNLASQIPGSKPDVLAVASVATVGKNTPAANPSAAPLWNLAG